MADNELPPRRTGEDYNPFAAPESVIVSSVAKGVEISEAERIRQEYIGAETGVRSIGLMAEILALFLFLLACIQLAAGIVNLRETKSFLIYGIINSFLFALLFALGLGLRHLKNWARVSTAIMSIPGILIRSPGLFFIISLAKRGLCLHARICRNSRDDAAHQIQDFHYCEVLRFSAPARIRSGYGCPLQFSHEIICF